MKQKYIDFYMDVAERASQLSYALRLKVGAVIVKDNRILSYGYNGTPGGWDNSCENIELMSGQEWLGPEETLNHWPLEGKFWVNGQEVDTRYRLKTKQEVLHAESNALAKLARSTESGEQAILFITHSPCIECAKLIYQSGIHTVYYKNEYRSNDGIEFLIKSGVNVHRYTA